MQKNYGYKYFSSQRKQSFLKKLSFINGLLMILQISFGSLFLVVPAVETTASSGGMCEKPADIVLIIDRSGSMNYTSRCDWWRFEYVNGFYEWVPYTTYNQNQAWCTAKNQPAPHQSVYLAIDPKKIDAAKTAANTFLDLMGINDQSSLVSYANTATLDKGLSNNHPATKISVNSLVASGATNIGDAIRLGTQELRSSRVNPQANHAMILLTDGKANKPNGSGLGENSADVAYAQSQAVLAAASNFKIFTIGLGENGEINEDMLRNIATTTGANYYHAPTQNDLQAIYSAIASRLCDYGSISGCKYSDVNNDHDISGEGTISDWEITYINNNTQYTETQLTDVNGCFQFSGLTPGTYTVSEGGKTEVPFEQTYPVSGSYAINLAEGENITDKDFGNYLPICGNQFVDTGYTGYGEVCEIGDTKICTGGMQSCLSDCSGWDICVSGEFCGDGQVNGTEQCDGQTGVPEHYTCTSSCTLEYIPYCGDNEVNQPEEQCDNSVPESCTTQGGYSGTRECAAGCIWAVDCTTTQTCGDGTINGSEICDDGANNGQPNNCNSSCTGQTPSICGNSALEGSEQCDDGNLVNGDGCDNQCVIEIPEPVCGNSIQEGDEQCDGQIGAPEHYACTQSCTLEYIPYCGDSIRNGQELCDDGTNNGQYGYCNSNCTGPTPAVCGNGTKEGEEQCDDGNTASSDGCNSTCQTESGGGQTGSLKICKYQDSDGLASTTNDRTTVNNWNFTIDNGSATSSQATITNGCTIFSALTPGQYLINEESKTNWHYLEPANGSATSTVQANQQTEVNFYNVKEAYCGDNVCSNEESCSSCSTDCGSCSNGGGSGGSGGGLIFTDLIISNEGSVYADENIIVTWLTNKPATSRVIYDTVPHPDLSSASAPNYGYAFSTALDENKVTGHSVTISGLTPGTTYYFRPLSSASPEKYGVEIAVITLGKASGGGQILGERAAAPPASKVLGVKITAPENQATLKATGFSSREFGWLITIILLLSASNFILRKYEKI